MVIFLSSASLKSLVQDVEKGSLKLSSHEQRVSEEQNNESQKQKVGHKQIQALVAV